MVSQVSVIGGGRETDLKQASIKFRLNRNPVRSAAAARCSMHVLGLCFVVYILHAAARHGWPGHLGVWVAVCR